MKRLGVALLLAVGLAAAGLPAQAPREALADLNTATLQQLAALPGMGPAYARRVIDNRPYTAKNQLATRGILPVSEYNRIAPLVVAHRVSIASKK